MVAARGDHGPRRKSVREPVREEQRGPPVRAAELHRGKRLRAHHTAGRHPASGLPQLSAVARDHRVPGRVPRGQLVQPGQIIPEPDADPRRPHVSFPRPFSNDPRQSGSRRGRTAQFDQHHPWLRHNHEKSKSVSTLYY